jgi:hypothetical protein
VSAVTDPATVLAVEALDVGERAERKAENADALAQAAYGTAAKAEQDATDVRRAVASRWILDNLGNQSVWLGASVMEVAAERRNSEYRYARDNDVVRTADWLADLSERGYKLGAVAAQEVLSTTPYVGAFPSWRRSDGLSFKSRASWEASREAAARKYGAEAELRFMASVVQRVADDVTVRLGFEFWTTHYVSVEHDRTNDAGPYRWTTHRRRDG